MIRILGVMTGTSCDGLDAVCVEFSGTAPTPEWRVAWSESVNYPKALRHRILKLQLPGQKLTLRQFLEIDSSLGDWYGECVSKMIGRQEIKPDLVANHGQTVAHFPDLGATLQLGDPSRIAHATGLTVISHFREGDMAAGGEGAPLLPLFHRMLASRLPEFRSGLAIHNLGGISNLSYIPPNAAGAVIAFDTGPSNIWIDEAVSIATKGRKSYDAGGALARKGTVDEAAVRKLLKHPYFRKAPPKSTGRDDFPFSVLRSKTRSRGENLIATATAVTVESIAQAYEKDILGKGLPLQAIYCAGGGGKNEYLLELLRKRLAPVKITRLADAGIEHLQEQVLEPLGFAMFGFLSLAGEPVGGSWTGAEGFGPPGWITPGKNWPRVISRTGEIVGTHSR